MALQIRRGLQANLPVSPADGELLYATDTNKLYVGDGGTAQEISGGGGGGATTLDGLTDVVITGTPTNGQVLKYDTATSKWINDTDATGGGATNLDGLTDVVINSGTLAASQVLKFDGSNWVNATDSGLTSVSQDSNPALGGNLTLNSRNITGTGNISINGTITGTSLQPSLPALATTDARLALGTTGVPGTLFAYSTKASLVTRTITDGFQAATINWSTSRGTLAVPTAVQPGDILGGNTSYAYDGSAYQFVGTLQFGSGATVASGHVSGFAGLLLTSDSNPAVQIAYTFDGSGNFVSPTVVTSALKSDTNTNLAITAPGTGYVTIENLRYPSVDGSLGQVLTTNGSGVLSWTTPAGGTGLTSRIAPSATTGSLADGASGNITITGYKGYALYKVQTSAAAWVRIYTSQAARTADSSRAEGVDPGPGAGVITEVITTGAQTIVISPGTIGFSDEGVPTTAIYVAVKNKSGGTTTITVTLSIVQLEA